jgi:hypothetical protein
MNVLLSGTAICLLSAGFRSLGSCPRAAGWSTATLCIGTKRECQNAPGISEAGGRPAAPSACQPRRSLTRCGHRVLSYDANFRSEKRGYCLFPDPTIRWRPYRSIIDGIERGPFVFDQGLWRGVLYLIVVAPNPGLRAYGIEISCEIYSGIEEMIYSVADHGDKATGRYGGGVYIKEAENSALLKAYAATDPVGRKPRHFSFVGSDYCYEVLGFSDPTIRAFGSPEEAYAWGPSR